MYSAEAWTDNLEELDNINTYAVCVANVVGHPYILNSVNSRAHLLDREAEAAHKVLNAETHAHSLSLREHLAQRLACLCYRLATRLQTALAGVKNIVFTLRNSLIAESEHAHNIVYALATNILRTCDVCPNLILKGQVYRPHGKTCIYCRFALCGQKLDNLLVAHLSQTRAVSDRDLDILKSRLGNLCQILLIVLHLDADRDSWIVTQALNLSTLWSNLGGRGNHCLWCLTAKAGKCQNR